MEAEQREAMPTALIRWLILGGTLLTGMLIGVMLIALVAAGSIYDYRDDVDAENISRQPVDVVVILAGAKGRIEAGADLWKEYRFQVLRDAGQLPNPTPEALAALPSLYVSGMGKHSDWAVFAGQVKSSVLEVLPRDKVVLETESDSTRANAIYFREAAARARWGRMLLVTSSYHMKRARYVFEQELRDSHVEIHALSVAQPPFTPTLWRKSFYGIQVTLIEYLKWIYYQV